VHPRAATQAVPSDHTSLQRWAPEAPRVPRPRTSPPCRAEIRCRHVSRGPGPRLLTELSSGAATCSLAPDLASLSMWAPALPHIPWLRALPPREESSDAATCSSAPDLASLSRWAPALPRGPPPRLLERRALVLPRTPRPPVGCGSQEERNA
jgi:hypothetical protein